MMRTLDSTQQKKNLLQTDVFTDRSELRSIGPFFQLISKFEVYRFVSVRLYNDRRRERCGHRHRHSLPQRHLDRSLKIGAAVQTPESPHYLCSLNIDDCKTTGHIGDVIFQSTLAIIYGRRVYRSRCTNLCQLAVTPWCAHRPAVTEALELHKIKNRRWSIFETSTIKGRCLFEGLDCLSNTSKSIGRRLKKNRTPK